MKQKLIKQMQKIFQTTIEINEGTKHDAFFDFSGHVHLVSVRIVKKSYTKFVYYVQCFLNISENPERDLNRILEDMQKYIPKEKK